MIIHRVGFPYSSDSKATACSAGDAGSILGLGRPHSSWQGQEGNGSPPQHSCLENSMASGARQATAHGVTKSQTRLSVTHMSMEWSIKMVE